MVYYKWNFDHFSPRFYSSLKEKCAVKVSKEMTDWIKVQQPGPFSINENQPTSNVFIADFIELNNFQFSRTVIALNEKIFKELIKIECNKSDNINDPEDPNEIRGDKDDKENTIKTNS